MYLCGMFGKSSLFQRVTRIIGIKSDLNEGFKELVGGLFDGRIYRR